MSVINAQRPLAIGMDTAALALRNARERLGVAAFEVARQGAALGESSTKENPKTRVPALTPPNPGPPGGAVPGDLAEAMLAERRDPKSEPLPVDLLESTVTQIVTSSEIAANTKTVQAFDAMLEELSRATKPEKTE
jgi:hypothetical protein